MYNFILLKTMAKSKSGGTRSYIRGRVGADVYSIGKDGKGKKQQVVRSLAESVANPQTISQMRGRMIMSTIMQVVAELRPIIDHSFDNVIGKQPNISEFIRRNYSLVKADVAANPSSGNKFGLNKYQEKGAKQGCYVIASGQAVIPSALVLAAATGVVSIALDADAMTIAGLKSKLGFTTEDYFTVVGITAAGVAKYERFRVNPSLADDTVISAENIDAIFATEGNALAAMALNGTTITLTDANVQGCVAIIISKKTANGYVHNDAVLADGSGFLHTSDIALPTYPVGAAAYLNGGDIFGSSESQSGGGSEPAPVANPTLTISKSGSGTVQVLNGSTPVESGASVAAGTSLTLNIVAEADKVATAAIGAVTIELTNTSGQNYSGTFTMPSANAVLSVSTNTAADDEPGEDEH